MDFNSHNVEQGLPSFFMQIPPQMPTNQPPLNYPPPFIPPIEFPPMAGSSSAPTIHNFPHIQKSGSNKQYRLLIDFISNFSPVKRTKPPKLNVSMIVVILSGYKQLIVRMERITKYLNVTKKSISQSSWDAKCQELEKKKMLLVELNAKFADPHFLEQIQRTVKRQKSKRDQRKRKKIEWQQMKKDMTEARQEKNKKIDLWLEKMKDEVESACRAETVKKEADAVLFEVTKKKNEAKRLLSLFNSLAKLRNAKLLQLMSSNKHVSQEETNAFNTVIGKLTATWVNQLKEYNLEEQGLKVMLNDVEVEKVTTEEKLWKSYLNRWTKTLFGTKHVFDPLQADPSDLNSFTAVRKDWDQFHSSAENAILSSSIPTGWIVPAEPSNADWSEYNQDSS